MYVIVEIAGQQFKVEQGKKLFVHYLSEEEGAELIFDRVLLADKEGAVTVGSPTIEGAKVIATVISPLVKGEKVIIFHKKRRKGYKKRNGHRQCFTELAIKEIVA